jgi:hypothetical protein
MPAGLLENGLATLYVEYGIIRDILGYRPVLIDLAFEILLELEFLALGLLCKQEYGIPLPAVTFLLNGLNLKTSTKLQ